MPALLLTLVGDALRRVGPAPLLEAGVSGVDAGVRVRARVRARGAHWRCVARAGGGVRAVGAPADRRRPAGRSGARRAVQEVGDDAGRTATREARHPQGPRDAAGRRSRRRATGSSRRSARWRRRRAPTTRSRSCCSASARTPTKVAKFNLPGPDMAAEDFAPLLARLKSKRVVFVDTTSASGPFVEALSGPGRVIVDGDADRRREVTRRSSAGRSSRRSRSRRPTPIATARSRSSRRSSTRRRPWRLVSARRAAADRARAARRQRRQGRHAGAVARGQGRAERRGAEPRLDAASRRCRPTRSCARCMSSARRSSGGSSR